MTFQAVFAGYRRGVSTPLVAFWHKLDAEGSLTDQTMAFNKKGKKTNLTDAWIGDVYEIDEEDGLCRTKGPRLKQWENQEDRSVWKLESQSAEVSVQMDKTASKDNFGEMTLNELRAKYGKTIGSKVRAAMVACIVQHVTR